MSKIESSTTLGYENELWTAADKLRGSMDAGEYKHVVLGLIFLNMFQMLLKQNMMS